MGREESLHFPFGHRLEVVTVRMRFGLQLLCVPRGCDLGQVVELAYAGTRERGREQQVGRPSLPFGSRSRCTHPTRYRSPIAIRLVRIRAGGQQSATAAVHIFIFSDAQTLHTGRLVDVRVVGKDGRERCQGPRGRRVDLVGGGESL